jgi:hypothetical protein
MVDEISINVLQIKSSDYSSIYQHITESVEISQDFMQYKSCSECGRDHGFKPNFNDIKTSIDHTSEMISLFFKEESK